MEKFNKLDGIAAPLDILNIDTDMIIPKQFLKTIKRSGLGKNLFDEMRYSPDGEEIQDFVLNKKPWNAAKIIIAGDNFGCGSSREHAPWALLDFGIKCVISTSFADIFYNNCFKNGILPIVLGKDILKFLFEKCDDDDEFSLKIDLDDQIISGFDKQDLFFDIDPYRKTTLLKGLDEIGQTLEYVNLISDFERKHKKTFPWLF